MRFQLFWVADWEWGLALIVLTMALHASGIVGIALMLTRIGIRLKARMSLSMGLMLSIVLISGVGLLLAIFHGLEASLWAATYLWLGALPTLPDAMLYSVDSMTTRGASGLVLQTRWQMLGALESADGVLLFGLSTAFLFAVVEQVWTNITEAAKFRLDSKRQALLTVETAEHSAPRSFE